MGGPPLRLRKIRLVLFPIHFKDPKLKLLVNRVCGQVGRYGTATCLDAADEPQRQNREGRRLPVSLFQQPEATHSYFGSNFFVSHEVMRHRKDGRG